jgi:O-antigen/teichoic acid export membrane protein
MSTAKRFLSSSMYNATEKVLRIVINFAIFIMISNTLSIEEMGQYNFLLTAFAMLSVFSSFGLTENATKIFIDQVNSIKAFQALLGLKFCFSILFAIAGYFWLFDQNIYFFIGLILSSLSLSLQFLESMALGKLILKVNSLVLFITSAIKIWACITHQDLAVFCQIFALEILIQSALLFIISLSVAKPGSSQATMFSVLKGLKYRDFLYIWFSASISILYTKVDQFFVKFYLSDIDVGIYTYATRIVDYGLLLPSLIISSLMGYLYVLDKKKREVLFSTIVITALVLVILINAASFIVASVFLPKYQASLIIIGILSLGLPCALLRALTGKFLIIDGLNQPFLARATALLFINAFLCFFFIDWFGLYGAALANLITMLVSGFLIDLIHKDSASFFKIKYRSVLKIMKPKTLLQEIKRLQ